MTRRALRVLPPNPPTPVEEPVLAAVALPPRPRTRGDCIDGPRPCPYVSCAHHLFLEVRSDGDIRQNTLTPVEELKQSCTLDVADQGPATLDEIGAIFSVSKERVRQIVNKGMRRIARYAEVRKAAVELGMKATVVRASFTAGAGHITRSNPPKSASPRRRRTRRDNDGEE